MLTAKNSKYNFLNHAPILTLGIVLFFSAGWLNLRNEMPAIILTKQETAINVNKTLLKIVSTGNKRLITDLLWIQTLIESDLEHYSNRDLNNWLYLRFMTVQSLDPLFYQNYLFGGQFLAIVKDDLEGADSLYEKGIEYYPNDYSLNFNAGFLNYFEIGNFEKGLKYLEKVKNHPRAPYYLISIINKLKASLGVDLQEVFKLVQFNYENATDENLRQKLRSDLYAIKAEIDLKCLNNNLKNCEHLDLNGDPYINQRGTYYSLIKFLPFRINKRGESSSPQTIQEINTFR